MLDQLPENPTPQDDSTSSPQAFGFPANPTANQLTAWHNQERFLQEFSKHGRLNQAAAAIGLQPSAIHRWDSIDLYSFKKRKQLAMLDVLEKYEAAADQWALEGIEVPIIKQGQCVGTTTKRSELLMMFRMKKLDPSYRDNHQPQQANTTINITQTVIEVRDYRRDASLSHDTAPRIVEGAAHDIVTDTDDEQLSVDE